MNRTVLFSGRFDPPHIGHWISILRLADKFKKVKVVVLDYPERRFNIQYVLQIFDELTGRWPFDRKVEVMSNSDHFGKITKKALEKYEFDVYAAGNMVVLNHINSLGIKCMYVDRAFDFEAHRYIPKWEEKE